MAHTPNELASSCSRRLCSLTQAIGATTPAFTAALALLMLAKKESLATYSALVPVVAGIVLATGFEPSYNAVGFSAAMAATAARAVKAIIQVPALNPRPLDSLVTAQAMRDWTKFVMFVQQ